MARLLLIGDPVAHSLSPQMQNAGFRALGLAHRYELLRVAAAELGGALERLRNDPGFLGANVTIPHKEAVAAHLDGIDDGARAIGAVNTIYRRDGALRGGNTDAPGFADALAEGGIDVRGRRVLLLGAGGAARACAYELARLGARLTVANRDRGRLERFLHPGAGPTAAPIERVSPLPRSVERYDAVVNATSLGLRGEDPLEGAPLRPGLVVVDVVALPGGTPLIQRAEASGCATVEGLLMLLHQGARAFTLWTGLDAPLAAMRAALPLRAS